MKKSMIILFNLGGPEKLSEVKSFLFNLFYDKAIIRIINPFRWVIAKLISNKRNKYAQDIYKKIGSKSPILANTQLQAQALINKLDEYELKDTKYEVLINMRYSKPNSDNLIEAIQNYKPDELIFLPLYPQLSTTTTISSFDDLKSKLAKSGLRIPIKAICCYPTEDYYLRAHIEQIEAALIKAGGFEKPPKILFSAHSIPKKFVNQGDPYQWQVEKNVQCIVNRLNLSKSDYLITYQSKLGPIEWLGPATDKEILTSSKQARPLIIIPIAFVSEHSETLVELDIDYRQLAIEAGCPLYIRVATLSINRNFINSLAMMAIRLIKQKSQKNIDISSCNGYRICPKEFQACPNNF